MNGLKEINRDILEHELSIRQKEILINEEQLRLESLKNTLQEKMQLRESLLEHKIEPISTSQNTTTVVIHPKRTPFDSFYKESVSQTKKQHSAEYIRLKESDWKETIGKTAPIEFVSVSHISCTEKGGQFVNFERTNNFYGCNIKETDFNATSGVFVAPSFASYLISVINLSGEAEDLYLKFSHPKSPSEPKLWKVPYHAKDVKKYFTKSESDIHVLSIPNDEIFIYNIIKDSKLDLYSLQAFKRSTKRNKKIMRMKCWREEKRKRYRGTGFFHFPNHNTIRLQRELRDEVPEPVNEEAFASGPADLFARTYKLLPGTRVSVIHKKINLLDDKEISKEEIFSDKMILFTVGLIKLRYSSIDWVFRTIHLGNFIINDNNIYSCYKCGKAFQTWCQLLRHIQSKNYFPLIKKDAPSGEFISPLNGKHFKKKEDLEQHLKTFKKFKCHMCIRKFFSEVGLQHHVKKIHLIKKIINGRRRGKCPFISPKFCCVKELCGSIFMDSKFLQQHHKNYCHYKCPHCIRKFVKKESLYRHIKAKHDIEQYKKDLKLFLQTYLKKLENSYNRKKEKRILYITNKISKLGGILEETQGTVKVTEGPKMEKSPTSHSVINIVPPRDIWGPVQSLRTLFIPDARCGPHFSFLDPFIFPKHYPEAAKLLTEELSNFKPFTVVLNNINYFIHSRTISLFLEPTTEPPDAFHELLEKCLKVFPQCNDLVIRSKTGKYIPHMTIARFGSESELNIQLEILKSSWKPLKFEVKELYFLSRVGGDPFEVKHVIPLGNQITPPYFGPGSLGSKENPLKDQTYSKCIRKLSRSCIICNLSQGITLKQLDHHFNIMGLNVIEIEILKNPDGNNRNIGVIEFKDISVALKAIEQWDGTLKSSYQIISSGCYLLHLPNTVFPCYGTNDCCSLDAVKCNSYVGI